MFLAEILFGHIGAVSWKNRLVQIKVECFVKGKPEPSKYIPTVFIYIIFSVRIYRFCFQYRNDIISLISLIKSLMVLLPFIIIYRFNFY